MDNSFVVCSLNTRRFENFDKVLDIKRFCEVENPDIICLQEISVETALKVFYRDYNVIINCDQNKIGIATIVKKEHEIHDVIISSDGRIIAVKLSNLQVWNIYAPSGSENKKQRNIFFRENVSNLMSLWKDQTSRTIQMGDFNCTQRMEDSENEKYQKSHIQEGLLELIKEFDIEDELYKIKDKKVRGIYSRVTSISKTRIDFISSGQPWGKTFKFYPLDMLDYPGFSWILWISWIFFSIETYVNILK